MNHPITTKLFIMPREQNDNSALTPELWAYEGLMQVEMNSIMAKLVHRDFENVIAEFGDVVNANRPKKYVARTKNDGEALITSDATVTKVPVKLDQWVYETILLGDRELSVSFKNLIETHVSPMMGAIVDRIDQILCANVYSFLSNSVGRLGASADITTLSQARKAMVDNGVPAKDRYLVIGSEAQSDLDVIEGLVGADKIGDDGSAIREGALGRKYTFDIIADQHMPSVKGVAAADKVVTSVDNTGGHGVGATAITVASATGIVAGSWLVIDGDDKPRKVASVAASVVTLADGLTSAVADTARVVVMKAGAINQNGGYVADYAKMVNYDGLSGAIQYGQLLSIANDDYVAVGEPTATSVDLNKNTLKAFTDNQAVFPGPEGEYGLAFHKNAMALVTRPLAGVIEGAGARSAVIFERDLAIRVTIGYDMLVQKTRVTADVLCGTKVLDERLGAAVLCN